MERKGISPITAGDIHEIEENGYISEEQRDQNKKIKLTFGKRKAHITLMESHICKGLEYRVM